MISNQGLKEKINIKKKHACLHRLWKYTNNELSFSRFILKDKTYEGDKEELKLSFIPWTDDL